MNAYDIISKLAIGLTLQLKYQRDNGHYNTYTGEFLSCGLTTEGNAFIKLDRVQERGEEPRTFSMDKIIQMMDRRKDVLVNVFIISLNRQIANARF